MKINKRIGIRAQGHVEIILSMVLFVGFLIFIFIFMNPFLKTKQEPVIIDIQEEIISEISSEIGVLSVIVNSSDDCYSLDNVNDEYGDNFIEVQDLKNPRRYIIYYGDFFDDQKRGKISCTLSKESRNFSLGLYTKESIIVEEKIKDLKERYETDYSGLKQALEVRDFLFNFRDMDEERVDEWSIVNKKIPENVDVVSKDIPIRVMDNKAEIYEMILNIKVW